MATSLRPRRTNASDQANHQVFNVDDIVYSTFGLGLEKFSAKVKKVNSGMTASPLHHLHSRSYTHALASKGWMLSVTICTSPFTISVSLLLSSLSDFLYAIFLYNANIDGSYDIVFDDTPKNVQKNTDAADIVLIDFSSFPPFAVGQAVEVRQGTCY